LVVVGMLNDEGTIVSLDEMKEYLRVDFLEEDRLITQLLSVAEQICMDIVRTEDLEFFASNENAKAATMYTVAYLYEHREEADHHELMLTLRSLLFGSRKAVF
jgi:uncharacterized phage protein (predicted DNA packaging)